MESKVNIKKYTLDISDIILVVRLDMVMKNIKSEDIKVIISSYNHLKKYFGFRIINPKEPTIIIDGKKTFYIYDDFYDYEGSKDKAEIANHYNEYYHVMMNLPDGNGMFRIDYKPND